MGGVRMSSSVPQSLAHTNVSGSSMAMTTHPPATSSNTWNFAGAMQHTRLQKTVNMQTMLARASSNFWQHREQSRPHLIKKARVKSTIGIVSTPRQKQSKLKVYIPFQILFNCQFQGRNHLLGFRECSPIQDCWRLRIPFANEGWKARVLYPIRDNYIKGHTNCFCPDTCMYWADASSKFKFGRVQPGDG